MLGGPRLGGRGTLQVDCCVRITPRQELRLPDSAVLEDAQSVDVVEWPYRLSSSVDLGVHSATATTQVT